MSCVSLSEGFSSFQHLKKPHFLSNTPKILQNLHVSSQFQFALIIPHHILICFVTSSFRILAACLILSRPVFSLVKGSYNMTKLSIQLIHYFLSLIIVSHFTKRLLLFASKQNPIAIMAISTIQ